MAHIIFDLTGTRAHSDPIGASCCTCGKGTNGVDRFASFEFFTHPDSVLDEVGGKLVRPSITIALCSVCLGILSALIESG